MTRVTGRLAGAWVAVIVALGVSQGAAQGGGRGGGFGGGGFQISLRQIVLARVQQSIGIDDEEWSVIEPKLWRVVQLGLAGGNASMPQVAGMLQRLRNRDTGQIDLATVLGADANQAILQEIQELVQRESELQTVVDDPASSDVVISAKLAEYRLARKKVDDDLAMAQSDLQSVLTLRQEALVMEAGFLQ